MNNPEDKLQEAINTWMSHKYPNAFFFGRWDAPKLNSSKKYQNARMVQAAKARGLKTKLPDWWVEEPIGGYHGLRIELKADKKGAFHWMPRNKCYKIEKEDHYKAQGEILQQMNERGYFACFAEGLDEAMFVIDWYMNGAKDKETYFEDYRYSWGNGYVPIEVTIPKLRTDIRKKVNNRLLLMQN